ncbi:MAG: hypothetical protein MJ162_00915, partial [Treponema sp.]|nr:hypothetical protein [Treponema sp.]
RRQMRIQEDERRAYEEAEAAKNRKAEENEEIERAKAEFASLAQEQKATLSKKVGAEEKINAIEQMKESICAIREDIQNKKDAYNEDKDIETNAKIQEIRDAEYRMTETDSMGNPTKDAQELRKKKIAAVRAAAEKDKVQRGKELQASIQATDDKAMSQLKTSYSALEAGTYTTNSFTNDLTVRIGNFDGQSGTWPLTVTSELFGYTTLFEQEIPLSYTDVTGKKYKPISKMNEAQFAEYTETVELYDSLFRSTTEVFYVNLTYKISKWSWASQYRFEPVKCEIVRLDKKSKVLHKVTADDMKKVTFTMYPTYEVRTKQTIDKEQKKIAERIAKEEKADAKKHPVTPSVYGSENSSVRVSTGTSAASKAAVTEISQKGRGCLIVTADVNLPSNPLQGFDPKNLSIDSLSAELTFKTGKFSFVGLEGNVLLPFDKDDLSFSAGLETGFSARLGFVRPFVKFGADLDNQLFTTGKIGTGFDFIMLKVMDLTIGCDYNWQIDTMGLIAHKNGPEFNNYLNKFHKVYAGVGFAW